MNCSTISSGVYIHVTLPLYLCGVNRQREKDYRNKIILSPCWIVSVSDFCLQVFRFSCVPSTRIIYRVRFLVKFMAALTSNENETLVLWFGSVVLWSFFFKLTTVWLTGWLHRSCRLSPFFPVGYVFVDALRGCAALSIAGQSFWR